MADKRTPAESGPETSPEQQILGILAAEDGDNLEPVGDVADEAEVEETEADVPEVEASEEDTDDEEHETDEEEAEDEPEQEPEEPSLYTIKVDGEEITVTLDELRNGYSRQSDYTRKAQALAEQRRAAEQELAQARAEREHYQRTLQQLQQQVMAQQEKEPDWDRLYQENPVEATRLERQWRVRKEQQAKLYQEQYRVAALQQQEQAEQMRRTVEENRARLTEVIPEWKDPNVAAQERTALRDFLMETGFGEGEISQIYDHRAVALARDAMRYRQQQQKRESLRPTPSKKGPKTAAPRAAATPAEAQRKSTRAQKQRLQQTGSIDDAAAVLVNMI